MGFAMRTLILFVVVSVATTSRRATDATAARAVRVVCLIA